MAHLSDAFLRGVVIEGHDTWERFEERTYLVNICERSCFFLISLYDTDDLLRCSIFFLSPYPHSSSFFFFGKSRPSRIIVSIPKTMRTFENWMKTMLHQFFAPIGFCGFCDFDFLISEARASLFLHRMTPTIY